MRTVFLFFLFCWIGLVSCKQREENATWKIARGNAGSNAYSSLDQINTQNVQQLKIAWTFHTRDSGYTIQCNPIIINDIMYVTSPALKVMALKAATGELIWQFDSFSKIKSDGVNRGVTYWENGTDKRIFFSANYKLFALNAETGQPITSFGEQGIVDLRQGLDRNVNEIAVEATSPGIIFGDLLITGSRVSEGEGAAPGHVRAYNVLTGKQAWIFHTIPKPGEYGYD
ncbi:MAG TPA: PQQ-binding-like beta-propeller repeat protein, partial [Chitinophagaceae bacterium]|nr:PQQ-binding-like beta-propeller repeat protein [Chitinophagaceae bacterium]